MRSIRNLKERLKIHCGTRLVQFVHLRAAENEPLATGQRLRLVYLLVRDQRSNGENPFARAPDSCERGIGVSNVRLGWRFHLLPAALTRQFRNTFLDSLP